MKVSGFTIVRDAIKFGYPAAESIKSLLPVCDEVVVAVGKSTDETLQMVKGIGSDKIRIIETVWDESLRQGGRILAQQTDVALGECRHDWCFYLQADEVVHEKYYPAILNGMETHLNDQRVQGLIFDYLHFYGSYWTVGTGRNWYRREVRIVRNKIGVRSYRDAQGFRLNGNKLQVKHAGAQVFHYGWAKPTDEMTAKQKNLEKFWHPDGEIEEKYSDPAFQIFGNLEEIALFTGSHPEVMRSRAGVCDSNILRVLEKKRKRKKFFRWIEEDLLHARFGEYKNYKVI